MARLRASTHGLVIERGRYLGMVRSERKCRYCDRGVVESEEHILLDCVRWTEWRRDCFRDLRIAGASRGVRWKTLLSPVSL